MLKRIRAFIDKTEMIRRGDRITAAVSGGADSVCLFFVLLALSKELDFTLSVLHVHHGIRGEEADKDAAFVAALADRYGIPCRIAYEDVPAMARARGEGLEEAGRNIRRELFFREVAEGRADKVALAHHRDDVAETFLMNLARGSGLQGLVSLKPVRGALIRPLLAVSRADIEEYLRSIGESWRTDGTNASPDYLRNRVRNHILPAMEAEMNARAAAHIAETAELLMDADQVLADEITRCMKAYALLDGDGSVQLKEGLVKERAYLAGACVREAVKGAGGTLTDLSRTHVRDVLSLFGKQRGGSICLPGGVRAERTTASVRIYRERLSVTPGGPAEILSDRTANMPDTSVKSGAPGSPDQPGTDEVELLAPGEELPIPYGRRRHIVSGGYEIWIDFPDRVPSAIPEKSCTNYVDYDKISDTPTLRTRRAGDRMAVFRDGRSRSLGDVMTDKKIPVRDRERIPLLASGAEVLWAAGLRRSESALVGADTVRVMTVCALPLPGERGGGKAPDTD